MKPLFTFVVAARRDINERYVSFSLPAASFHRLHP
jgi:hypothetical protein